MTGGNGPARAQKGHGADGLFTRKSKWDLLLETVESAVESAASSDTVRLASKVTLGVVGGVVAATAASAAISAARNQGES